MELSGLFPQIDFAWKLRMRKGDPSAFFYPGGSWLPVQRERLHKLDSRPDWYLSETEQSAHLVSDCWALIDRWGKQCHRKDGMMSLAHHWEADFLFLDYETFSLAGGCVCFPSSWSLAASAGKPLTEIHGRVPDLQEHLGDKIRLFLERIPDGQTFLRENWSITRTADLDYHPGLNRRRIDDSVSLDSLYLRLEHQAFVRLEHGVLMGLRIQPIAFSVLLDDRSGIAGLRQMLVSMPEDVAIYKGLERGRQKVVSLLSECLS